ncbi:hypothetical protein D7X33_39155 [Butyricicoccus sp. 1XD8-22]|nr:hypothetical protein D7X33_39155 [Butyricicoccus sp. 1XD8-22]
MYQFNIFDVNIPLKQPLPCLHYDFATYCSCLKQIIPAPLPEYLLDLSDVLEDYSKQIKRCRPKSFPKEYRIYLIDYRLNILFAALDSTGNMANSFSRFGKEAYRITDCYYGDGELIGDFHAYKEDGEVKFSYNSSEMLSFVVKYGFLPIEELAAPTAMIFAGEDLLECRSLSQYQLCLLLEQFRSKNLLDWKQLIKDAKSYYGY